MIVVMRKPPVKIPFPAKIQSVAKKPRERPVIHRFSMFRSLFCELFPLVSVEEGERDESSEAVASLVSMPAFISGRIPEVEEDARGVRTTGR